MGLSKLPSRLRAVPSSGRPFLLPFSRSHPPSLSLALAASPPLPPRLFLSISHRNPLKRLGRRGEGEKGVKAGERDAGWPPLRLARASLPTLAPLAQEQVRWKHHHDEPFVGGGSFHCHCSACLPVCIYRAPLTDVKKIIIKKQNPPQTQHKAVRSKLLLMSCVC